jgi:hypothetical protein
MKEIFQMNSAQYRENSLNHSPHQFKKQKSKCKTQTPKGTQIPNTPIFPKTWLLPPSVRYLLCKESQMAFFGFLFDRNNYDPTRVDSRKNLPCKMSKRRGCPEIGVQTKIR